MKNKAFALLLVFAVLFTCNTSFAAFPVRPAAPVKEAVSVAPASKVIAAQTGHRGFIYKALAKLQQFTMPLPFIGEPSRSWLGWVSAVSAVLFFIVQSGVTYGGGGWTWLPILAGIATVFGYIGLKKTTSDRFLVYVGFILGLVELFICLGTVMLL